jgi:hypothetical protein
MKNAGKISLYILTDWLAAAVAWTILYVFRKLYLEPTKFGSDVPLDFDMNFFLGLALVPLFWLSRAGARNGFGWGWP